MNEDIERIVGDYVIVEGSVFGDNLAKRKDATDDDAQFFFVERVSRLNDEKIVELKRMTAQFMRLNHPALVPLQDVYFDAEISSAYLVWVYEGVQLSDVYFRQKQPLPLQYIVQWGMDMCDALIYFHEQNPPYIVETVRPYDIVITQDRRAKLFGYGLGVKQDSLERVSILSATPELCFGNYFAPEHTHTTLLQDLTPQYDIYCLGSTLHQLLTRKDPFQDFDRPLVQRTDYLASALHTAGVPKAVSDIVVKATHDNAEKRYTTVRAMKADLHALATDI
ncbi:MAG: protein kinase [Chloroflexota bacterium]